MKSLSLVLIAFLAVTLTSCLKKSEHYIRVKNDASFPIQTVIVGPLTFKDIKQNSATEYKEIPMGSYKIEGDFTAEGVVIDGKGKHEWSIVIDNNQKVILKRDK